MESTQSLEQAQVRAGREVGTKKWLDEEPRTETFRALGLGAHLLAGGWHALQAVQSPLDVPHALLQCSNCPHQPRVQFLRPRQAASEPLCGKRTQREEDSGGNSARGRVWAERRGGHNSLYQV